MAGIAGIGGLPAGGLSALAQAYRQQVLASGPGASGASGAQGLSAAARAQAGREGAFAGVLGNGLSSLEATNANAAAKAVQAATGDLSDVHDYVIAATQAQVATELTTTVRNKALDAFNDIMRMSL